MSKEIISDKQGITIVILFLMGSALLFSNGIQAKQDIWLANIVATLIALPILLMYARLLALFPGKDLFDILPLIFGQVIGKGLSLLYVWFAFHLGVLVLINFGEFINVVSLPETPMIVPMICLMLLCVWGVKEGIEVIGRWGEYFLPIIIFILLLAALLSIPKMDFNNLRPVLYDGIKPVIVGAFSILSFPLAETVILLMVFSCLQSKKSYRVLITGLLIGAPIILLSTTGIVLLLGVDIASIQYFPSYSAIARVTIGDFLQRIEIVVSVTFLIGGFVKISMCLLAASDGIAKIFAFDDYRFIVMPIAFLMIDLSYFIYDSTMEMVQWAFITWPYYAFPFQVILPLIILIVTEFRIRSPRFQKKMSDATLVKVQNDLQTFKNTIIESTRISEDLSQVATKLRQVVRPKDDCIYTIATTADLKEEQVENVQSSLKKS